MRALQATGRTLPLLPSSPGLSWLPTSLPPLSASPKGIWAGQSSQAPLKPRETARRGLLMNFKTTETGDLESIRFYYLFIKKSVTDNSVKGSKRCSRPTQPEERTWGWVGGAWRRGPSQLGTLGCGGEGFRK